LIDAIRLSVGALKRPGFRPVASNEGATSLT
jgi:hypothetical protein